MNLVSRATNILTNPRTEWPRINAEPASAGGLMMGYALPLALLAFVGSMIDAALSTEQFEMMGLSGSAIWAFAIATGLFGIAIGLAILYVMSLIANGLAPNFGGVRNPNGALKLLVYSGTAVWVAGFLSFVPWVGWLIWLLGYIYAAYLIYVGSTSVMKVPASSALGYTLVVIAIWILVTFLVSLVVGIVLAIMFLGGAIATGGGYMLR